MRSGPVVGLAIVVGQQLCLSDRGEELAVQELAAKSRVKRLTLSVLPGRSWVNEVEGNPHAVGNCSTLFGSKRYC